MEAGKKAAGEVLALQKRVLAVLSEARYGVTCLKLSGFSGSVLEIYESIKRVTDSWIWLNG